MIDHTHIELFQKYKDAGAYAFGGGGHESIVSDEEKEVYWGIYEEVNNACEKVVDELNLNKDFFVKPMTYSSTGGSRGHRPKDLWCAVRNNDSEAFNNMPQIYLIVSERGVETGFAVSISEDDYHDQEVKGQNREIIPHIHRKLPVSGPALDQLDQLISSTPNWHVNSKTRLIPGDNGFDAYDLPSELFRDLKSQVVCRGGGAICRIIPANAIASEPIDLDDTFKQTLTVFADIQRLCVPTAPDRRAVSNREVIQEFADEIEYDPESDEDGREKKLRRVAVRFGQRKFRTELIEAYNGCCAISGCAVQEVLQAAHIMPYRGKQTNVVSNGLLLRADFHNLFDLFLISIDPETFKVKISSQLKDTDYFAFDNQQMLQPTKAGFAPNVQALEWHFSELIR